MLKGFVARAIRLYEQEPGETEASSRFGLYVRRWVRWTNAGLAEDETRNVNDHGRSQRRREASNPRANAGVAQNNSQLNVTSENNISA